MTELAAAVRFVHLAAAVLLTGSYAFGWLVLRPAARTSPPLADWWRTVLARIAPWALAAVIVSGLAGVAIQASRLDTGIWPLLSGTRYGMVWLARLALAVLVGVLMTLDTSGRFQVRGLGLSALLLGSLALSGHAAAGEGTELALHLVSDAAHLVGAGMWLGALVPFGLLLARLERLSDAGAIAGAATRRFSILGAACVSVLLLSGFTNAVLLVGGIPELIGTAYGRWLLLKLALLVPLLGIAAFNLLRLGPAVGSNGSSGAPTGPIRMLRRNALAEAGLGLVVLAIVALLASMPPARHAGPEWPFAFRWDWTRLDRLPEAQAAMERALLWLSAGIGIAVVSFFLEPPRRLVAAIGAALAGYAIHAALATVTAPAVPTSYARPVVPYHAISVANGRSLYRTHCASCHGASGGDGSAAVDLRAPDMERYTPGELYWIVTRGRPPAMGAFDGIIDEEERWDVVNFMRVLRTAQRVQAMTPAVGSAAVVAPDFAYGLAGGGTGTLRDHRGERMVLLILAGSPRSAARLAQLARHAAALRDAGVEPLVVPPRGGAPAPGPLRSAQVVEGNDEIHAAYAPLAGADPAHAEFLIDRQGYLRARWIEGEAPGWDDIDALTAQVERLRAERLLRLVPEEHFH